MRNDTAKRICEAVKLRDVMEAHGVRFNSRGFAKCPFHSEKTASLSIKNEHYKCFGCGAYGNAIDFIMRDCNLTFPQALVKLDSEFCLGLVGKSRPQTRRDRIEAHERELVKQAAEKLEAERNEIYFALCDLHQDLLGRVLNGEGSFKDMLNDVAAALDDFNGEGVRLWTEMLKKHGYIKKKTS